MKQPGGLESADWLAAGVLTTCHLRGSLSARIGQNPLRPTRWAEGSFQENDGEALILLTDSLPREPGDG